MKKIYLLRGLDCPNCSVRIEKEVGELDGVSSSSVNLIKQTLTVEADDPRAPSLLKQIKKIVRAHEPDVAVSELSDEAPARSDNNEKNEVKIMMIRMSVGALIFALGIAFGLIFDVHPLWQIAFFIPAYIILGGDVLLQAAKNIIKGRVFDENFLMSLSTLGAFIIGEYPEAVAVMLFYQVGEYFQDLSVRRSRRSISALMDIRPDSAAVIRNGEALIVPPEAVKIGETVVIRPGERVPLDGEVVSGESSLDTRALTGESAPRYVRPCDTALSGCINIDGTLTVKVTKTYGESTASKIIDLVENAASKKAPTENFITGFARCYTPAVVIIAALLAIIPSLIFGNAFEWIRRALVFLVISCPCALVISIPLTFFGGIGAASKHGVLIKGSNYLEALNRVDTVVFDKTGTLTKGVFAVTEVTPANGFTRDSLLLYAAHAESFSNHPIARSIISAYGEELDTSAVAESKELPGRGVCASVHGKKLLAGNERLMESENIEYTPLSFAGTKIYVAVDGIFAGSILISDEVKPDARAALSELKKIGVNKTVMLTGDGKAVAESVARELGIDEYFSELLPADKVLKVDELDKAKKKGEKLAFVGDGINDAPVLARADVGIAMGALGSDAAIEAADVVLMTDEPSKIVEAISVARATRRIVIENIILTLTVKGAFLILGAFGLAGMWEAVFGDVGVALIAVLNAMRIMKK